MGEIRVKSENLVESYVTERDQSRFSGVLYAELDLKKDTTYTIALNLNNGYKVYINEHIFAGYTEITGDDTVKILSVKTKSDLEKKVTTYTDGKGWLLLKNAINESDYISVADFQILEGTYTSETIPPYQPYFLNLPSHEKTSTGWKDIPTHTMTANGWQGELTSQSPLEFRATGQSLLDWRIDGASGGVGDWDETEQRYKIPVTVNGVTTTLYTDAQLMDGDSIDFTTDQTTIPITQGDNTLTVETAVQPKSVFVKFEG